MPGKVEIGKSYHRPKVMANKDPEGIKIIDT